MALDALLRLNKAVRKWNLIIPTETTECESNSMRSAQLLHSPRSKYRLSSSCWAKNGPEQLGLRAHRRG